MSRWKLRNLVLQIRKPDLLTQNDFKRRFMLTSSRSREKLPSDLGNPFKLQRYFGYLTLIHNFFYNYRSYTVRQQHQLTYSVSQKCCRIVQERRLLFAITDLTWFDSISSKSKENSAATSADIQRFAKMLSNSVGKEIAFCHYRSYIVRQHFKQTDITQFDSTLSKNKANL